MWQDEERPRGPLTHSHRVFVLDEHLPSRHHGLLTQWHRSSRWSGGTHSFQLTDTIILFSGQSIPFLVTKTSEPGEEGPTGPRGNFCDGLIDSDHRKCGPLLCPCILMWGKWHHSPATGTIACRTPLQSRSVPSSRGPKPCPGRPVCHPTGSPFFGGW